MIELNDSQAFYLSKLIDFASANTSHNHCLLEGRAGVGKTTLVCALIEKLMNQRIKIAVAAPTNKAVKVLVSKLKEFGISTTEQLGGFYPLTSKSGVVCKSIHSFLGLKLTEKDNGENELKKDGYSKLANFDLVIIDECTMVDDYLYMMIDNNSGNCLILFVGDRNQLPPVSNKLRELSPVFDNIQLHYVLSEVVRQAKDNPIIKLSSLICDNIEKRKRTILSDIKQFNSGEVYTVNARGDKLAGYYVDSVIDMPEKEIRIICYTNDVVNWHNKFIHETITRKKSLFCVGEKVIFNQPFDATVIDGKDNIGTKIIINSSELVISEIEDINIKIADSDNKIATTECKKLTLIDGLLRLEVLISDNQSVIDKIISDCFDKWKKYKNLAKAELDASKKQELDDFSKLNSSKGWGIRNMFANVRHCYAITAHKSQGSTFDTAFIDWNDLNKIKDDNEFNRCLNVAVTRSSNYLVIGY